MKKNVFTLLLAITAFAALTACGRDSQPSTDSQIEAALSQETEEVCDLQDEATEAEDFWDIESYPEDEGLFYYPSNDFEDRVGRTSFESYDEIIGLLQGDEAYALLNVKGYDGQVLAITSYTYDDLLGHIATTECYFYTMKGDVCTYDGVPVSVEGFVRASNTILEDNSTFLQGDELDIYNQLFVEYYDGTEVINFTRVNDAAVSQQ